MGLQILHLYTGNFHLLSAVKRDVIFDVGFYLIFLKAPKI